MKKRKKARREYTQEQLEKLRAGMAKAREAREARAAKKQISVPDAPESGVANVEEVPLSSPLPAAAPETHPDWATKVVEPLPDGVEYPKVFRDKPLMQTPVEAYEEMKGGDAPCPVKPTDSPGSDPAPTSEPESAGAYGLLHICDPDAECKVTVTEPVVSTETFDTAGQPFELPRWAAASPLHDPVYGTVTELPNNPALAICGDKHVDVGNSENLIIGLKIPVIPHPSRPGYWLMTGPLPRLKGRW